MLFNSLQFLVYLPVVLLVFAVVRRWPGLRNAVLLMASYTFYGAWDWRFLGLLWLSTLLDYSIGLNLPGASVRRRRLLIAASLVVNLGILGFFKYAGFGIEAFASLLAGFGLQPHLPTLALILPVGISFYTFQTIGYTLDVAAGRREPVRNLRDFALFVAWFPQLVAGPIERSTALIPQLQARTCITYAHLRRSVLWILTGYFLKVVVADSVAPLVNEAYARHADIGGPVLFMATWAFALQIFGDFAGYTLIARGVSEAFGIRLMENFRSPYVATSPQAFWQRWHISLSTWFQEYLYNPLALTFARRGWPGAQGLPIFLTMLLIGFWHGAGWNFILFGAFWGVLLAGYNAYRQLGRRWARRNPDNLLSRFQRARAPLASACKGSVVFLLTLISFVFFRSPDLSTALAILLAWVTDFRMDPSLGLYAANVSLLFAIVWGYGWIQHRRDNPDWLLEAPPWLRWSVYLWILLCLLTIGFRPIPFIYFQF